MTRRELTVDSSWGEILEELNRLSEELEKLKFPKPEKKVVVTEENLDEALTILREVLDEEKKKPSRGQEVLLQHIREAENFDDLHRRLKKAEAELDE